MPSSASSIPTSAPPATPTCRMPGNRASTTNRTQRTKGNPMRVALVVFGHARSMRAQVGRMKGSRVTTPRSSVLSPQHALFVAASALLRPFLLRQPEFVHAVLQNESPAEPFPPQVRVVPFEDRPHVLCRLRGVELGVDLFEEFPRHLLWHPPSPSAKA